MALTCGFFNSINKDRLYDAIQFGQIFDGIIADGVYATYLKGMVVIASDNPNEVIIQPGRAWFNHTWSYNDANLPFEAPEPEVLLDRIDTLVLDVNLEQAERNNTYIWVQGTPSSQNPQPPALIRSITHNQYPLCDVYRKAGTTMIYTKDITNRIGTSDTPFATGVLEGIDLDMWINQWDNEFHTWEIDTKAEFDAWELNSKNSFETWMISQQQVYTAWFNSIKDQMSDDLAEFEAWFETIKDIIDESVALHLQAEIDEINKMLPSGSHITITTENTELFGRNVTVTDGIHPTTVKFDNSGVAEVETYPYVGNIIITSTDGIRTATTTTHIPYFGRYSYGISFWAAVVNIIGDEELANYPVTVKNSNGDILTTIILDSSAQGTWTAIEPDTYTFSVTYGGETMEVSLNVTQETTYTVEIHAQPTGFDFEEWLTAGDVSGTYADLDAVLADEVAVRKLMTKHASVDYLASFTDEDESVIKILNNDLCAKWISLRDYAMDVLEAAYGTLMDTIGKYGYGEWALMPQVPNMTSATAPCGEVISSSIYSSGYEAYRAFDGNASTEYCSPRTSTTSNTQYIGYKFTKPTKVNRVWYRQAIPSLVTNLVDCADVKIQYSDDGTNWTDIDGTFAFSSSVNAGYFEFDNDTSALYWRIITTHPNILASGWYYVRMAELQFYAWQPKGNVPIMTSNTAPYGEASGTSVLSGNEAYKAFDGSLSTSWRSNGTGTSNLGMLIYKFANPVNVRRILHRHSLGVSSTYQIKYSDDGSTWTDAGTTYTLPPNSQSTPIVDVTHEIPDSGYHLYWCTNHISSTSTTRACAEEFQFYGRELKVSVPTMTGNTTPYGEAFLGGALLTSYPAFRAFDGNSSTEVTGDGTAGSAYVGYDFGAPCKIQKVSILLGNYYARYTDFKIQGSNDGFASDIHDLSSAHTISESTLYTFDLVSTGLYRYYRVIGTSGGACVIYTLQFYGFDYSEYDWDTEHPRHYIYDHGLELEELEALTTGNGWTPPSGYSFADSSDKLPNALYIHGASSSISSGFATKNNIDYTDFSGVRIIYDPTLTYNNVSSQFCAFSRKDLNSGYALCNLVMVNGNSNFYVDCSSINQNGYAVVQTFSIESRYGYVYELYLE